MKLVGTRGTALQLKLEGYQFPGIEGGGWDANWLIVRGRVDHPRGGWIFRDPCLTTFEVQELASWLDAVAQGESPRTCSFLEPNIELSYRPGPKGCVIVAFSHESTPPWSRRSPLAEQFAIEFPLALNDLEAAAQALREQLVTCPPRGEVGQDDSSGG